MTTSAQPDTRRAAGRRVGAALLLTLIVLAGAWLRISGHDWDADQHLHPDEILITRLTIEQITWPPGTTLTLLVDPATSPLNVRRFGLPYGSLPIYLTKAATVAAFALTQDRYFTSYNGTQQTGRLVNALLDSLTILLVAAVGRRLWGLGAGIVAAALYAGSILAIQQAHYATVDTPLTLLLTATLLGSVGVAQTGRRRWAGLAGVALGLALACKITALSLGLLPLGAILLRGRRDRWRRSAGLLGVAAGGGLLALALGDPFALLDIPGYLQVSRLVFAQNGVGGDQPFTRRWVGALPVVYSWGQLALLGSGPLVGVAATGGLGLMVRHAWRARRLDLAVVLLGAGSYFAAIAFLEAKWVRYLLPLVPYLCLGATAFGYGLARWGRRRNAEGWWRGLISTGLVGSAALGALACTAVYRQEDSRVQATRWIVAQVPPGSRIGSETGDYGLPLPLLPDVVPQQRYHLESLDPLADQSSAKTSATLYAYLNRVDYVTLSSERNRIVPPRMPWRYPVQARYYELLFAGRLGLRLVYHQEAHPALFGAVWRDEAAWADSSFIEYDHPPV